MTWFGIVVAERARRGKRAHISNVQSKELIDKLDGVWRREEPKMIPSLVRVTKKVTFLIT